MNATAKQIEMPDNQIGGVPSGLVMTVWPTVEPILKRVVLPESGHSMQSVLTELQLAKMQLWIIGEFQGVAVTSINILPLHNVLWAQFLAGDHMDDWLDDLIEMLEAYARHNNCASVEFSGRKGWNKIGEKHREYRPIRTVFRRVL